jgi:hypothetical protein
MLLAVEIYKHLSGGSWFVLPFFSIRIPQRDVVNNCKYKFYEVLPGG